MLKIIRLLARPLALLLFAITATVPANASDSPEYRAMWVDTWNKGFNTPSQIDQLLTDARRGNLNVIIPQVRRRGDAFYDSTLEPKNPLVASNFDPLAYLIEKAQAADPPIEVHPWIVVYPVGSSHSSPEHVLNKHPDTIMHRDDGETFLSSNEGGGYWLDPAHPQTQQHTLDVAMDIISRYDIDGFHFDYIRYPNRRWGYNPVSVARFNQRHQRSGTPDPADNAWLQFRRDAITETVRRIYLEAVTIKPDIKISAATIGQGGAPSTWTSSTAYVHRLQDWRAWMEEGILDINMPMLYFNWRETSPHNHRAWWDSWVEFTKDHKYDRHLSIGPAWYWNTIADSIEQIRDTRAPNAAGNRADGISGYHYHRTNAEGVSRSHFFNTLSNDVFSQPAPTPDMPWKTNPTNGHLRGLVSAGDTGKAFDGARVTISGPRNVARFTDPGGFYGAVDLSPGTYTVTARYPRSPYAEASGEVTVVAGEVATLDLELEFSPAEDIILNHTDAHLAGAWTTATFGDGFDNGSYLWADTVVGSPTHTATYTPQIDTSGTYDVYAWWVELFNRTTDARHQIIHTDGTENISIDQTQPGSGWVRIGENLHFSQGNEGFVRIINSSSESDARVIAGAVRFVLAEPDPDPSEFFGEPIVYPAMENATVVSATEGEATVRVEYGTSELTTSFTEPTSQSTTKHSVTIDDLSPGMTYHARVHATAGTRSYASDWFTFQTMNAVIIDNTDSEVSFTGTWSTGTWGAYYGTNYHRSFEDATGSTATYRPNLPIAGVYDVYTWYPSASSYTPYAEYRVRHADGEDVVAVNQQTGGGSWELLASGRRFDAGSDGFVRIRNTGNEVVIADAQRWVLRETVLEHTVATTTQGDGSLALSPEGPSYEHGTEITITPIPEEGWAFSHWEGLAEETDPLLITLYSDREITAVFQPLRQLTTETHGSGSIVIEPKQELFATDSDVTVTAKPAEGYEFAGWSGSISSSENPFHLWMDEDKHLIALFQEAATTYEHWLETHFDETERKDETITSPTADPGDYGIPNLLRYAFGMDPRTPDSSHLPAMKHEGANWLIAFRRLTNSADIEYRVQVSTDLATWEPGDDYFVEVSVEPQADGTVEQVILEDQRDPNENRRGFVRLRVVPQ